MSVIKGKLTDIYSYRFIDSEELKIVVKANRDDGSPISLDLLPFESRSMIEELNKIIRALQTKQSDVGEDNFLIGGRLVPIKREGNIVYARSLRRGEEDTGEAIHLNSGDRPVIPPGELVIDSRDIDDQLEEDIGGYKPISPVLYVFSHFLSGDKVFERRKSLLAIGRWMDSTYLHWKNYTMAVRDMRNATGDKKKTFLYKAWASAEQAVIMLHRLNKLVRIYNKNFGGIKSSSMLDKSSKTVKRLRDKIEHTDEEAFKGATVLSPMSRADGSNTLAIGYIPDGKGDCLFLDIENIIQPLIDLRESVVDSLGFVKPSDE